MDSGLRPPRSAYFGIALLSFVLLGSQLILTRIFSVILWYHFAFLVVSLVMLGMAAGGSLVYALPHRFTPETVFRRVAHLSAASGVLLFAGVGIVLAIPGSPLGVGVSQAGTVRAVLITLTLLPSFIAAGIVVAALFDAFPNAVPTLYAADLLGAGLGAVVALWLMWQLSGPSLGLLMGALLIGSGTFFAASGGHSGLRMQLALLCASLLVASLANDGLKLVRVRNTKTISLEDLATSEAKANLIYERWSPIAYLTVFDNYIFATKQNRTFAGWGVGSKYSGTPPANYHCLQDAAGGTLVTRWSGNVADVSHLDYDVTALPYHLRRFDAVLIVGPGGGRDVLTALRGRASEIVAVEMNPDIIDLMTHELRDFSGGLYLRPEVKPIAAEARSWLTRSARSFDLIQLSLIDSWAATAAGAMVFAENNLYTVEAFELYLDHLHPEGVLSISRWFTPIDVPAQTLKVVSIAAEALRRRGIEDPSQHIIVARGGILGTVLISNRPFRGQDYQAAVQAVDRYGLQLIYPPGEAAEHREFVEMLTPGNMQAYLEAQPIDLRPVYDDRPFFFVLSKGLFSVLPARYSHHNAALKLLAWLIGGMTLLGVLLVLGPLLLRMRLAGTPARGLRGNVRPLLYFVGLGAGFMLIEVTLLQRLIVYLGHPTYAATMVLTTLLIGLGLGSAIVSRQDVATSLARQKPLVAAGMAIVLAVAVAGPTITRSSQGAPLLLRVALAAVMLTLVALPLGTLLPTGMRRLVAVGLDSLIPWAWAVNGVAGVIFSAMALMLAIHWGYTLCLLIGVGFYGLSLVSIPARTKARASAART